jgi:hypothetical protein
MQKSREKKYQEFLLLTKPSKDSKILDVGVADQEYSPFDNYLEQKYPYPHNIKALSMHSLGKFKKKYPDIKTIKYDGDKFPFNGKEFQIVHSNAVIEHVGGFEKQLLFINEMVRVGDIFYFTTPAKEFPIEMHTNYPFIHWLSKKKFNKIVTWLGQEWASGNYMNLLLKRDVEHLLKKSNVREFKILIHKIGPFPLHYAVSGS